MRVCGHENTPAMASGVYKLTDSGETFG